MAKIALCSPHNHPNFDKDFFFSFILLLETFYNWNKDKDHELKIFINNDGFSGIAYSREKLVEQALDEEYEYILCLDTDMSFPPNLIPKMIEWLERDPELDAVSGLYQWKKAPFVSHVYSLNKETAKFVPLAGFPLKKGFYVDAVGFGCVMIKSIVFDKLDKPWFDFKPGEYGEDMYFFAQANQMKFKMLCDPTLACNHFVKSHINVGNYLEYNSLDLDEDGHIIVDKNKVQEIDKEHAENAAGGSKNIKKRSLPQKIIDKIKKT